MPRARPAFRRALLRWYAANRRDLPWRQTRDPYRIWVSEIMLQQTRVAAVLEHYRKFLKPFPDVQSLAAASETAVLAAWSGLGYYRRARMMHAAAGIVAREFGGELPRSAAQLESLPGIGRYTAAAISSIAFGEARAVVDGNVERVLARLLGRAPSTAETWRLASDLLSAASPGDSNQAMMELGALVCLPGTPSCHACPVARWCATRGKGKARRALPVRKRSIVAYTLASRRGRFLLVQRSTQASLMPGMWELPSVTSVDHQAEPLFELRHSITTTDYRVRIYPYRGSKQVELQGRWVAREGLSGLPLTGLARKALRLAGAFA